MPGTDPVSAIVVRRPFAVLGYSAEGAVYCPVCLRVTAGLSPSRTDFEGAPILPLYARDVDVREERCGGCDRPLTEVLVAREAEAPWEAPRPVRARTRVYARRTALDFDRCPPVAVRDELKRSGWRWDPAFRVWWSCAAEPQIPSTVELVCEAATPKRRSARPPVVRRRSRTR